MQTSSAARYTSNHCFSSENQKLKGFWGFFFTSCPQVRSMPRADHAVTTTDVQAGEPRAQVRQTITLHDCLLLLKWRLSLWKERKTPQSGRHKAGRARSARGGGENAVYQGRQSDEQAAPAGGDTGGAPRLRGAQQPEPRTH